MKAYNLKKNFKNLLFIPNYKDLPDCAKEFIICDFQLLSTLAILIVLNELWYRNLS